MSRARSQRGSAVVWLPLLLWLTTLLTVAVVDVGGQLLAAARAGALADAAALAAVSAEASPRAADPVAAARRVAAAGDGRLEACACAPGRRSARARVSVAVPGLVWPRLGPGRQVGAAEATLVPGAPPPT